MKLKYLLLCVLFSPCIEKSNAQVNFTATGGDATGAGGSSSYSIGQLFFKCNEATNETEIQGVQQPFEISEENSLEDITDIQLTISAYPNPVEHDLMLEVDNYQAADYNYRIYNIEGKLLKKEEISSNISSISMSIYKKGTFLLKVSKSNTGIKTFKIIKN